MSLGVLAEQFRQQLAASRVTVRSGGSEGVDLLAEARAPGVPSMADGPQPGIVAAPTYVELERTRSLVVQDDTRTDGPRPPQSLIDHYRVYAQMLAPIERDGALIGTISVHMQDSPRRWSDDDRAALTAFRRDVEECLLRGDSETSP